MFRFNNIRYICSPLFFAKYFSRIIAEIQGSVTIKNALYLMAENRCPFSNWWIALWLPQPGHSNPVSCRNGHRGKSWHSSGLNNEYTIANTKSMTIIIVLFIFEYFDTIG